MVQVRKRLLEDARLLPTGCGAELDLAAGATIAYSSENPAHPVDRMLSIACSTATMDVAERT